MSDLQDLERRRALRALLASPLRHAGDPEFAFIRRHREWLRDWFARYPAWSLHVDSEFARLRKIPGDLSDGTRPAVQKKVPFTRRRYVLLCLGLAALERSDRQTTLGRLADEVVRLALGLRDFEFTLAGQDQRRELVAVIRFLLEARVLHRLDGDEQQYLTEGKDVLYTVNRPILAAMLTVRRGPSTLEAPSLEALAEEPVPESEEGRNRRLRTRLYRRLLDDPVVYHEDLVEEERAYLTSQRPHLVKVLEEATGLVAEVRAEGLAMVDPEGELTDLGMPEEGTEGHSALLLAEFLAARPGQVGFATLHQHMAELVQEYRKWWRGDAAEPGGEVRLVDAALDRLEALGLARRTSDGAVARPALARFALDAPQMPAERDPLEEGLLFR